MHLRTFFEDLFVAIALLFCPFGGAKITTIITIKIIIGVFALFLMRTARVMAVNYVMLLPKAKERPPKFKMRRLFSYANTFAGVNVRLNMYSS